MEILSLRLKALIGHSIGSFVCAAALFGIAILLTYVEDWCKTASRPFWIVDGVETVSIMLFVTDSIGFLFICITLILEAYRETFKPESGPHAH